VALTTIGTIHEEDSRVSPVHTNILPNILVRIDWCVHHTTDRSIDSTTTITTTITKAFWSWEDPAIYSYNTS